MEIAKVHVDDILVMRDIQEEHDENLPKVPKDMTFLPKDMKAVRSFLGMVNQYSRFNSNISTTSAALRDLLKKDIPWIWDQAHTESFEKLKNDLKETVTLAYFDIKK